MDKVCCMIFGIQNLHICVCLGNLIVWLRCRYVESWGRDGIFSIDLAAASGEGLHSMMFTTLAGFEGIVQVSSTKHKGPLLSVIRCQTLGQYVWLRKQFTLCKKAEC